MTAKPNQKNMLDASVTRPTDTKTREVGQVSGQCSTKVSHSPLSIPLD